MNEYTEDDIYDWDRPSKVSRPRVAVFSGEPANKVDPQELRKAVYENEEDVTHLVEKRLSLRDRLAAAFRWTF